MSAWLNTSQNRGGLLNSTETDERPTEHAHKFLTAAQKRKVAAITGDVNSNADACIAYAVFTTPEEARKVISAADGTVFRERTLRVDAVRTPAGEGEMTVDDKKQKAEEERRTCFIGGLEFTETEEKLRAFVEATLIKERGEPDDDERWVQRVRIVRDKDTGLGKGFAYIMFQVRLPALLSPRLIEKEYRIATASTSCSLSNPLSSSSRNASCAYNAARVRPRSRPTRHDPPNSPPLENSASSTPSCPNRYSRRRSSAIRRRRGRWRSSSKVSARRSEGCVSSSCFRSLVLTRAQAIKSTDEDRKARRAAKKQDKVARERKERKRAARSAKA